MTAPSSPSSRGLSRSQWAALGGVVLLLVGALVLRGRDPAAPTPAASAGGSPAAPRAAADPRPDDELAALRADAALAPCPAGLGPAFPDLTLPCLGGGPSVSLRAAAPARPTLVNVWASWCAPCADEAPDLVSFARRAAGRVDVVGVLNTDTQDSALAFSKAFGIRYPSLVDDDGAVLRAFPPGPPVTVFLDASGAVVHTRSGAFTDLAELESAVQQYLGVTL